MDNLKPYLGNGAITVVKVLALHKGNLGSILGT